MIHLPSSSFLLSSFAAHLNPTSCVAAGTTAFFSTLPFPPSREAQPSRSSASPTPFKPSIPGASRPSNAILGEAPLLPRRVDVLIVGGGLTGLTAAHELLRLRASSPAANPSRGAPTAAVAPQGPPTTTPTPAERHLPFLVVEAGKDVGGCLKTRRLKCGQEEFLWDCGANSFRVSEESLGLLHALNLQQQLLLVPQDTSRFVALNAQLVPLPSSIASLLTSPLLSFKGKVRLARGLLLGARPWLFAPQQQQQLQVQDDGPSISRYISSVLGPEVEEKVVSPMVTGIYAGDPSQLSMQLALPALKEVLDEGLLRTIVAALLTKLRFHLSTPPQEQRHQQQQQQQQQASSSIREDKGAVGFGGGRSSSGGPQVANFTGGMQPLAFALADALPAGAVQRQTQAVEISAAADAAGWGFVVSLVSADGRMHRVAAKHVLLTLPPAEAAHILRASAAPLLKPDSLALLEGLPFASLAVVSLGLRKAAACALQSPESEADKESVTLLPRGFGFLVGPSEGRKSGWLTRGGICVSHIFEKRAPPGYEVFSAFVGGTGKEAHALGESDEQLVERVLKDMVKIKEREGDRGRHRPRPSVLLLPEPQQQDDAPRSSSGSAHASAAAAVRAAAAKEAGGARAAAGAAGEREVYYYRVLGIQRWPGAVAQFGLNHTEVLQRINEDLLEQRGRRFPKSYLLIEGGWVSGVSVGDRIKAGTQAARILAQNTWKERDEYLKW
ncbi:hypothetical protein Esti_003983 [Eimeria stiedai]